LHVGRRAAPVALAQNTVADFISSLEPTSAGAKLLEARGVARLTLWKRDDFVPGAAGY
jgi:hypothetical protein